MTRRLSTSVLVLFLVLGLTACNANSTDSATFTKAEGYPCVSRVIEKEYLVRKKDGSVTVVHAVDDNDFLENYFEIYKEEISTAEPNYRLEIEEQRSYSGTFNNWGAAAIQADSFWQKGIYGQGVTISVIDTGVDLSHPQIINQTAKNLGEMGLDSQGVDKRYNGIDDDGNGFVDDYVGYDFYNDSPIIQDNKNHGTHVAGIILAEHSDTVAGHSDSVQGIAPKAKLLTASFLGPNGSGSIDAAIGAINYSVMRGAKILNASWGGSGCSVTLRDEVRALVNKNVLFISAAGNNGRDLSTFPEYPASFEGLTQITVGSIDPTLLISDFSNFSQRFVHIFAPGGSITSTLPGGVYGTFDGTSMATPFVSGAAALIWSKNPSLSAVEVKAQVLQMVNVNSAYANQTSGRLLLTNIN